MPKRCSLFLSDVMYRDFFKCNPTNTNHYQYPKFETLSYDTGCHPKEVKRLLKKDDHDKYVIFYTRHTNLEEEHKNKIVGYFKVGRQFDKPKKGFYASESVLLPKDKCIEINYKSRGVPVSWGRCVIKPKIDAILKNLRNKEELGINITNKYQHETRKIMKKLRTLTGEKEIIKNCEKCKSKMNCFFGKRKLVKSKDPIKYLKSLYLGKNAC